MRETRIFPVRRCSVAVLFLFGIISATSAQTPASPKRGTISVTRLRVPERAHDRLNKAILSVRKNHLADALKYTSAAIAIAPDYPEALSLRGFLELNFDQIEPARRDLAHALEVDPDYAFAYVHMGSLLNHLAQYDDALRHLARAAELEPKSWECAFETAKSWLGKRDYERALAELDRATMLGGDFYLGNAIHLMRGDALVGLKRYEQGAVEIEAYLAAEPNGSLAAMARQILAKVQRNVNLAQK